MDTDCFTKDTATFWLRRDFALEFCFDDFIRQPPNEEFVRAMCPPGTSTEQERAEFIKAYTDCPVNRYLAYLGAIDEGNSVCSPYIWDGFHWLRVSEEGLYRSMLNRLAAATDEPRTRYPIIYPKTSPNPVTARALPQWVVLHDTARSLAGLVPIATAEELFVPDF